MIIATAGHVDHGKTLLVKALTGVDTDRLPEEKTRGMTIDLGFAYLPVESTQPIGFVDVPGHERFIHNMLSGLAEIDFALLIVAADDGPMPQTIEHLAILDLLGVRDCAVAITKIDRVGEERVAEVAASVQALFAGTSLAGAATFQVSAKTGAGIAALKQHLEKSARALPAKSVGGNFRLAVDRSFSIAGAGVVVTGTVVSGAIKIGDQAKMLSSDISVRVRNIHAHNIHAQQGRAGQRCALNLSGPNLRPDMIARGDWIVAGALPPPIRKFDARLQVLSSEARALAHWTPVHAHVGAAHVTARIAVLEGSSIPAGQSGLVQLVFDRPVGACYGDRFIVRDQSAQRTIGGGHVIDVFPPARGRAKPQRLAIVKATEIADPLTALATLLECSEFGLSLARFAANRNLSSTEARELFERVNMRSVVLDNDSLSFSSQRWSSLKSAALDILAAWHRRTPDTIGPTIDRVFSGSTIKLPREAAIAVASELAREGAIIRQGLAVRLPAHRPKLAPGHATLWKKLGPLFEEAGLRAHAVGDLAKAIGEDPKKVESALAHAARQGMLIRIKPNRFFQAATLRKLGEIAEGLARESGAGVVTVAALRDRAGIGRNVSIEVLEFFDRIKFTERIGDARKVMRPCNVAFGGAEHEIMP